MNTEIPAPVVILAAPFCGASSLAAMLGRHPQLCVLPELHLFMADSVEQLLEIFRISQGAHADGLLRAVAVLQFGEQSEAGIAQAREWLTQHVAWSTGELALHLAQRAAPRRLIVPDSESPLRPMDLRRLHTQLPQARIIHLLRHPYTQGLLHAHSLARRLFVPPDFKDHSVDPPRIDPQIPWFRCTRNIQAALQTQGASQQMQTRSEALTTKPEDELRRIAGWLGISAGAAEITAMQEPQDWTFAGYGPPTAPYGLEAEVLDEFPPALIAQAQRDARLDAPLPWRPQGGFCAEVITLATQCGYR